MDRTELQPRLRRHQPGNWLPFIGTDWASAATGGLQWWKWFIAEGGVRVPIIISPPKGLPFAHAAQKTHEVASVKDVPMTILDYAGIERPKSSYKGRDIAPASGLSMRDFFEGVAPRPRTERQWFAFELFGNGYVVAGDREAIRVRTGMYGDGKWHLYDSRRTPARPGRSIPMNLGASSG